MLLKGVFLAFMMLPAQQNENLSFEYDETNNVIIYQIKEEIKKIEGRRKTALMRGCPVEPGMYWNLECA